MSEDYPGGEDFQSRPPGSGEEQETPQEATGKAETGAERRAIEERAARYREILEDSQERVAQGAPPGQYPRALPKEASPEGASPEGSPEEYPEPGASPDQAQAMLAALEEHSQRTGARMLPQGGYSGEAEGSPSGEAGESSATPGTPYEPPYPPPDPPPSIEPPSPPPEPSPAEPGEHTIQEFERLGRLGYAERRIWISGNAVDLRTLTQHEEMLVLEEVARHPQLAHLRMQQVYTVALALRAVNGELYRDRESLGPAKNGSSVGDDDALRYLFRKTRLAFRPPVVSALYQEYGKLRDETDQKAVWTGKG